MKKTTGFLFAISLLFGAASCQQAELPSHGEPLAEKEIKPMMVKVSKDTVTVTKEFTYLLKAFVYPDDAVAGEIVWSSLQDGVASVDQTGLVTGVAEGMTKVVATMDDLSDTCVVKVLKNVHVESVSLNLTESDLLLGSKLELVATISPADANIRDVEWSSDNEAVATVDAKGVVTPVSEGVANITVKAVENGKTASCKVTVKRVVVTGVSLNKTSVQMTIGEITTLKAVVEPADATIADVTWSTTNAAVATVDGGKVTALADGSAVITVTTKDGGFTADCAVTVSSGAGSSKLTITYDLSTCPASLEDVKTGIPSGEYEFAATDGKTYKSLIYNGAGNVPTHGGAYLILNIADYFGSPVVPGATLQSISFVQSASTKAGKRKSAVTSAVHDGALDVSYYDASSEANGASVATDTQGQTYTFTILSPEKEKSYYLVCGAGGIGISSITFTYEVEVKSPKTLTFDFTGAPLEGWPTASTAHVNGGIKCKYPLDGVDYSFTLADCDNASACNVWWHTSGYVVMNTKYRYFGMPAIEGYKLVKITATHGTSSKSRMVGVAKEIEANSTHPDAAAGHGYVKGGELQDWNTQYNEYVYELDDTVAGKVYYLYAQSTGVGISKVVLKYDPE